MPENLFDRLGERQSERGSDRQAERRDRVRLALATLLIAPCVIVPWQAQASWQPLLALIGLPLLFGCTIEVLKAHRADVPRLGSLDALASSLTISASASLFVASPLRQASGAGELQVHLQLAELAGLTVVAATALVVVFQVGWGDRRALALAISVPLLLVAGAVGLGQVTGLLESPWV